ncbi:hypothetical protein [Kineococcus terrestris]|uniref:hypothetical protein n=1 Tax=Kineococcus terrestris TaxID=2044856 RepID=UPI0034DAD26B
MGGRGEFRDVVRQGAVVLALAGGIISGATGDYGRASDSASPVVPADYAFTVWVPVYAGAVAYAAHQARPSRRADALLRRTGWPLAAAVALSGTWVRLQDPPVLQLPAVAATTSAALLALVRAQPRSSAEDESTAARWLVRAPVGLLAGWLTLATTAATTEVLLASGVPTPRWGSDATGALVLAATAGAALAAARLPRVGAYAAAVTWGLAAVAVRGARRWPATAAVAAAGAGAVVLAATAARDR